MSEGGTNAKGPMGDALLQPGRLRAALPSSRRHLGCLYTSRVSGHTRGRRRQNPNPS